MKSFLSKYWKRILIVLTIILIFINIYSKTSAPHTLVDEYAKYGPNVETNSSISLEGLSDKIGTPPPISEGIMKYAIVLAVALIGIAILSDMSSKKTEKKKK